MDPLYSMRSKASMTKQGKAKQADVYFKKIIVLMSEKRGLGGVKGVADTLIELDRGYMTNYTPFCNWKQTIYRLHNNSSTYRVPTPAMAGYLTPYECRPQSQVAPHMGMPGLSMYRSRAEMKKDFDAQAYARILVGYGEEGIRCQVYLPEADKIVTSALVLLDETLPVPSTGYHAELEKLASVKVAPGEDRTVQSFPT